MATFPELAPSTRAYDFGEFPLTDEATVSAGTIRFRHGTSSENYRLTLGYNGLTDAKASLIRDHFLNQSGTYRSFQLPAIIWSGHTFTGNVVPYTARWRYIEQPEEEHFSVGYVNLTVTLGSDGTNDDAAIELQTNISFIAGAGFSGDIQAQGISLTVASSFAAGTPYGDVYFESDLLINKVTALLHFNGTNGSTVKTDSSFYANTVVDVFGAAAISTAQSKYGGASLAINTTTSMKIDNSALSIGSLEDFTVELWFYFLTSAPNPTIDSTRRICSIRAGEPRYYGGVNPTEQTVEDPSVSLLVDRVTGNLRLYALVRNITGAFLNFYSTQNLAFDSWSHIAYTRKGLTYYLFLNGVLVGSGTFQYGIPAGRIITIGGNISGATGYMDDFRVTRGVARYITNFTPPLGQHPDP